MEWGKQFGKGFHINFFGTHWVVISSLDAIKTIQRDREHYPNESKFRKAAIYTMGQSLFMSEGMLWDQKHKILSGLMSNSMLNHITTVVYDKSQLLLQRYQAETNPQGEIEIVWMLKRLTIDVIGEFAFGVNFGTLTDSQKTYDGLTFAEIGDHLIEAINYRIIAPKFMWSWPLPARKRELAAAVVMKSMFAGILEQTKLQLDQGEAPKTLVSLLLSAHYSDPNVAKNVYPIDEILGECFSVWSAGHETTAYTCCHALKLLAKHQNIQDKAREEVLTLDAQLNGGAPDYTQISKCKYLGAVIKEAQRLLPVAPFLLREPLETREVDGVTIKKGSFLLLNVISTHHNPEFYPNPEEFWPERWFDSTKFGEPITFLGFGSGTRACFGRKLALLEMKMLIFVLLKNYIILDDTAKHPHVWENNLGLTPENKKMIITLKARN